MWNTLKEKYISQKRIVPLILFGMVVLVILVILPLRTLFNQNSKNDEQATPGKVSQTTRNIEKYEDLRKTALNASAAQVEKENTVLTTTRLNDGRVKYEVKSELPGRKNDIITKDGKVVFEATPIFTQKYGPLPYVAQYIIDNGKPEEIIKGNKRWGWFTSSYIYPQKGLLFIANTTTSEIYEILTFTAMSLEEFKATYPEYIESVNPEDNPHI